MTHPTTRRNHPGSSVDLDKLGADFGKLLTPAEVADLFRVDAKTVTRWAKAGRLSSIKTLGGHRRYPAEEVAELLQRTRTQRGGDGGGKA